MTKKSKFVSFICAMGFVFVVGFVLGGGGYIWATLPKHEFLTSEKLSETFINKEAPTAEQPKVGLDTHTSGGDDSLDVKADIAVSEAGISIHFLELGNKYTGDCTFIQTDTCDILIDCGSKATSVPYVRKYLEQYMGNDKTLEYVIITHAHEDHYAGFATTKFEDSIFGLFECKNIIYFSQTNQKPTSTKYKNFKKNLAQEDEDSADVFTAQECIEDPVTWKDKSISSDGSVRMNILNSIYYQEKKAATENDYSVCTLFTYQSANCSAHNYLFTGDLEKEGEDELVKRNVLPQVDLYKAGHHGSKTSSNETLMKQVKPKVICVCCCAGSPEYTKNINNQFPTQDFIDRVGIWTADIYVTSLCVDYANNKFESFNGNIIFMARGDGYNMLFSNNATRLKDSEWFNRIITDNGVTRKMRTWPVNEKT